MKGNATSSNDFRVNGWNCSLNRIILSQCWNLLTLTCNKSICGTFYFCSSGWGKTRVYKYQKCHGGEEKSNSYCDNLYILLTSAGNKTRLLNYGEHLIEMPEIFITIAAAFSTELAVCWKGFTILFDIKHINQENINVIVYTVAM